MYSFSIRRHTFFPALLFLAALIAGCNPPTGDTRERIGRLTTGEEANPATTDDKPYQVVVIPQKANQGFLQAVQQGAEDAAAKFNAKIIWYPPGPAENEVLRQQQTVEEVVAQEVDGIVLAPADPTELVIPVNRAAKARIPIAIFDADVNTKNKLSLVATDNFKAGQLAARHVAKISGGRGSVGLILAQPAAQFTLERARGFTETLEKEFPQIKIIRSDEVSTDSALTENPEVAALFCPDQNITRDTLQIAQKQKFAGKAAIVGFGTDPAFVSALQSGDIAALVLPNPYEMGYESVKAVVDQLQLRDVPRRINTSATLVTRENINTPENRKLLQ